MSASTVLELLQPAVGCCANDAVLAVCQPVRAHGGTCSRSAAALGLHHRPLLQVCHAPHRLPPAVHRSHFSDRAFCTRMSGSCLGSSITTRPTVGDHQHGCRRSGRACSARCAHAGCRGSNGYASRMATCAWRRAAPRKLRGSPTHVTCMYGRAGRGRCHAKCPMCRCPGAMLSVWPVWVVFQDSSAIGRRNLSAVSSQ